MIDEQPTLKDIREAQKNHESRDIERFNDVHTVMKEIKENHLSHIEKDITELKENVTEIKADLGWVKWVVMALLGGVGAIFLALVIRGL